ncbi:MAG: hypothetical protein R3C14_01955 [Caldilineaceae bacterium]
MTLLHGEACFGRALPATPLASSTHQLLFIAYGNTLRRDDGAGLALAEGLQSLLCARGHQVQLIAVQQLMPELALAVADPAVDAVCFFDTAQAELAKGVQIHMLCQNNTTPVLGHHLIPSALLLYAQQLYHTCPPAWLVTIPGSDFELGEGFSETTCKHLSELTTLARQLEQCFIP